MKRYCIVVTTLLLAGVAAAQTSVSASAGASVATINGQPITEDDLAPLIQGQLRPLREQEYQIKRKALESLINQRILEAEAKKRNLTTEQFLAQEVDAKVPEP